MPTALRPIIRRSEVVRALERLSEWSKRNERLAYQLFMLSVDTLQKELSIQHWQTQVHHETDIQNAIAQYGGSVVVEEVKKDDDAMFGAGYSWIEFHLHVRRCLDCGGQTLALYEEILRREWPVDIRMLLQRHRLQCKERLQRLEEFFLPIPRTAA